MDLDLRRLRWFLEVARDLHFGRAAVRLSISQPALSAAIARFEDDLGVALFDRTSRSVRLTPAGEQLRREAPQLLDHAAAVTTSLRRPDADISGDVDFAYSRTSGPATVPAILEAVARRHPRIVVTAREAWAVDLLPAVADGRIDVAMLNLPEAARGMRRASLGHETQGLLVSTNHRLAGRAAVSLDDLAGERWLLWPRRFDPGYHDWIVAQLAEAGRTVQLVEPANPAPPARLELDDHTVRLAVRSCLDLVPPGFVFLPFDPPLAPAPLELVWRPDRETPQLRRFVEVARAAVRQPVEPRDGPRLQLAS